MKAGKLDATALARSVFPYTGGKRDEVILRANLGEDSAVLDLGEGWQFVLSTDPITGASQDSGWLAVHVSCNDIVSNGAEPVAVMLTLLLPEGSEEEDVKSIMESAHNAAEELGIEIIGGHTEITYGLSQIILSTTAIGKVERGQLIASKDSQAGQDLVLTKGAGIEGTAILLNDFPDFWKDKLSQNEILEGKSFFKRISVVSEAMLAKKLGAAAMHDVTEGGILGAIYEMAEAAGLGVDIDLERIIIPEVTKKICTQLDITPLKLISSGSLLIVIDDGDALVKELAKQGIEASVIGKMTKSQEKKIQLNGIARAIEKPESDELWTAIKYLKARA